MRNNTHGRPAAAFLRETAGVHYARVHTGWRVHLPVVLALAAALALHAPGTSANLPGGSGGDRTAIAGNGGVTVADNGNGTVTLGNGLVSIVIVKKTGRLNAINYTHHNRGALQTTDVLQGPGQYYYGGFMLGSGSYDYSLAADPATNGGDYGEVRLLSVSDTNGVMEIHFSMLRGSPGFYSTAILTHRPQDARVEVGAWGVVTRVRPEFNWVSADPKRSFFIGERTSSGAKVPDAPHEVTVNLNGAQQGQYADKFIFGQDHADLRAWGWSSVGPGAFNVGIWMMTNREFSDGGPLKRDVSVYPYAELNNSILTGEVGMGSDGHFAQGEAWTKTCGPWFTYLNEAPASVTDPKQAAGALYRDALAQADAEKLAWPYPWFKDPGYAPASGRGAVSGRIVIHDPGNLNASAAGTWVGLEQQPQTSTDTHDFQKWLKPYQFWVQADRDGGFTLPNVIAGADYTLWAYGPGAAGTFLSQHQDGGDPPLECDLPAKPFSVRVVPGKTTVLPAIRWTPVRVGATVFELGTPDRKASDFRHSDDYWAPGVAPRLGFPTPVWGGQVEYPLDFPDGMVYTVGKSRWATDWNYVLPSAPDAAGNYQPCSGTILFSLARPPARTAKASLYLGCAGDDGGRVIVSVNGVNLGGVAGAAAAPDPLDAAGFDPAYSDDSSIHFSDHGPFSDERITFPAGLLHSGQNAITVRMDARSLTAYLMVDYLRLELTGYVPPAPSRVTAYPGSHRVLVCWTVVPGATSYRILRSTRAGSGYVQIAAGIVAPVAGSGPGRAAFTDNTPANGKTCYYRVQSVNPQGQSVSAQSAGATPESGFPSGAPGAPVALTVTRAQHHRVVLVWKSSPAADFYRVWRSTLHSDGLGGFYPVGTVLLDDAVMGGSYTDGTPTDGRVYRYFVEAVSAGGTSAPSDAVTAEPLPPPPASAPGSLAARWTRTRNGRAITLSWTPSPGATGYVIYRSIGPGASFQWPSNFLTALVETVYRDQGNTDRGTKRKGLDSGKDYSYRVTAVNAGGLSPPATVHVPADPPSRQGAGEAPHQAVR